MFCMKKMLCAALFAMLAVSAIPVFAASSADEATGVQRYNCCGGYYGNSDRRGYCGRYYSDDDRRGAYCYENGYCYEDDYSDDDVYCDENGYCTYRRR